jgi:V/A-type H+-transporting ATPase subunit I
MSGAVNQLAAGIENNYLHIFTLVTGHLVIIAVETIVVFIQTTRLVVFEFFIRFLRAEGRVFRPINLPNDRPRK